MFYLSKNLQLISTFTDLNNIPKVAKANGVSKEQCQSLTEKVEEGIAPFSYCDKANTTILMFKSYE